MCPHFYVKSYKSHINAIGHCFGFTHEVGFVLFKGRLAGTCEGTVMMANTVFVPTAGHHLSLKRGKACIIFYSI